MFDYMLEAQEEMWDAIAANDPGHCTTCGRPVDDGYVNEAAGERCVDPCHPLTGCNHTGWIGLPNCPHCKA